MGSEANSNPEGEVGVPSNPEHQLPLESRIGNAVQWWLEKEAATSSLNLNNYLDKLDAARDGLLKGADVKQEGHVMRMNLWLDGLGDPELTAGQNDELTARIVFGGLMFLSGSYRRQRYMQATDQDDYMDRKLNWADPGGVVAKDFVAERLKARSGTDKDILLENIRSECKEAIELSTKAVETIYQHVPADFGKENSEPVQAMVAEQKAWLAFIADVIQFAMLERGGDFDAIPVIEHTTITKGRTVKLSNYTDPSTSRLIS